MTIVRLSKTLRPAIVALCFVLASVTGAAVPARSASSTALRLDPPTVQVMTGETVTLALWVDSVEHLHRVELHLTYNEAGLEVQDADPGRVGVQIEPGPLFCTACTWWNEAIGGEVHFVAERDPLDGPFSGSGIVAHITLTVTTSEPDTYAVSFDQAASQLLDSEGHSIAVDQFTNARLILPPPPLTLTGKVTREGWGSHERSVVNAILYRVTPPYEPLSWGRACTDPTGSFTLEIVVDDPQPPPDDILPAGSPPTSPPCTARWAFIRLDFTNCLSECYWECASGDALDIGQHDLEGGDVNGDGHINICDIVLIIGGFGESVGAPCYIPCTECPPASLPPNVAPTCDINGDCQVNILDLTQAAGNFGLYSNCP